MSKRAGCLFLSMSIGLHGLLAMLIFLNGQEPPVPSAALATKKHVLAVQVDEAALQKEIARLEDRERQEKQAAQAYQRTLAKQAKQARQVREKEEALGIALREENEQLRREMDEQRLRYQQAVKASEEKIKAEQAELAKVQQEVASWLAKKDQEPVVFDEISQQIKQEEVAYYTALIRNKIHQHWRQPLGLNLSGFTCKVAVTLSPTGEVTETQVIRSSGNVAFDRSTELAIHKASPLPVPNEMQLAGSFHQFTFTFCPEVA